MNRYTVVVKEESKLLYKMKFLHIKDAARYWGSTTLDVEVYDERGSRIPEDILEDLAW